MILDIIKEYLLQNWALILVLLAFVVMLVITVFLNKATINKMYVLIALVFTLSIIVFFEFRLGELNKLRSEVRENNNILSLISSLKLEKLREDSYIIKDFVLI